MQGGNPANPGADHMYDVFISFSSRNIDTARIVSDELESRGISCWLADQNRDDIPPGENWADTLMRALKNSKMVLLIFSRDSNLSQYVKNEIGVAFNKMLEILPMRIQDEKPDGALEYYLIHTQWFDFIPPPPPIDENKLEKLTNAVRRIIHEAHNIPEPTEPRPRYPVKVPFFSTWVLKPVFSRIQELYESIPPLDGALWTFLITFLVFFVPLAVSHRLVGDYPPQSLRELFSVAPHAHFYYPDLNAILFDMILHPAALATLVYFVLFLNAKGNQFLANASAGFFSTRNLRQARFWINMVNILIVKILPVVAALAAFFYRRQVYIHYGMKEPLVFWASFAVALSIYAYVALSIYSCYIALLLKPVSETGQPGDDDRWFSSEWANLLAKLTIIFIYIILMLLIEISVEWMMANFNGAPLFDLIRWITLAFGGISALILVVKILWLFVPEIGMHSRFMEKTFLQANRSSLLLLIIPAMLIFLTFRMYYQVH
jgi:TIR domain